MSYHYLLILSTLLSFFFSLISLLSPIFFFFFFNDTATTEIYTLSLHDALPISREGVRLGTGWYSSTSGSWGSSRCDTSVRQIDRKSTRLNSSHSQISYAVFCLKKKKKKYKKYNKYLMIYESYCHDK